MNKAKRQNTTYKSKDRAKPTSLKTGGERMCSGKVGSSCSTSGTCRIKSRSKGEMHI